MRILRFAILLTAGGLFAPGALAQSENLPPNVVESSLPERIDQTAQKPRDDQSSEGQPVGFVFEETPSTSDIQFIVPLAPRGDNVVNNQPVDQPAPK